MEILLEILRGVGVTFPVLIIVGLYHFFIVRKRFKRREKIAREERNDLLRDTILHLAVNGGPDLRETYKINGSRCEDFVHNIVIDMRNLAFLERAKKFKEENPDFPNKGSLSDLLEQEPFNQWE